MQPKPYMHCAPAPRFYAVVCFCATFQFTLAQGLVGVGRADSPEAFAAAVVESLTSIDSFDCRFTVEYGNTPAKREGRYARQGPNWHYSETSTDLKGRNGQVIVSCDDQLQYQYTHGFDVSGRISPKSFQVTDAAEFDLAVFPEDLLGMRIPFIRRNVLEIIASSENLLEVASLSETPSQSRAEFKAVPALVGNQKYDLSLTIDADHGNLPVEIRVVESADNQTWPGWERRWQITKYREVNDNRSGQVRWFPVEGVLQQGTSGGQPVTLRLRDVLLNTRLQSDLFCPEIPDGSTVIDMTTNGTGRTLVKGGRHYAQVNLNNLIEGAHDALDGQTRNWYVVANIGIISFLAIVVVWKRFTAYRWRKEV